MGHGDEGTGVKKPAKRAIAGGLRLDGLERDELSVFLYVSLLPEETLDLVKALGLSMPGFRTAALGEVERCDLIADEIRVHSEASDKVVDLLCKAYERPPMLTQRLTPEGARELLLACAGESSLPLSLWRVLSDTSPKVRAAASPILADLAAHYYAPAASEEAPPSEVPPPAEELSGKVRDLEHELERTRERGEEARLRGESQRDKLQGQLKEARAREAHAVEEAARARDSAESTRRDLARAEAALAEVQSSDAVQEAQRARAQARDLEGKVAALESRLERAREREREGEAALAAARATSAAPAPAGTSGEAEIEPDADVATWLMPIYTREFYDSLEGWDRRIQRAAFKQAHLLAVDHRHPSLRALPLEGLPGYYRVRVATDVRLLYRRGERQNTVEILSLIDREELDRYIRQAKSRG